jgi:hypothetical protein
VGGSPQQFYGPVSLIAHANIAMSRSVRVGNAIPQAARGGYAVEYVRASLFHLLGSSRLPLKFAAERDFDAHTHHERPEPLARPRGQNA